jgi:hypothetical protein
MALPFSDSAHRATGIACVDSLDFDEPRISEVRPDIHAGPIVKRHRRQERILGKRGLRAAQHGNHGSERGRNTHDP